METESRRSESNPYLSPPMVGQTGDAGTARRKPLTASQCIRLSLLLYAGTFLCLMLLGAMFSRSSGSTLVGILTLSLVAAVVSAMLIALLGTARGLLETVRPHSGLRTSATVLAGLLVTLGNLAMLGFGGMVGLMSIVGVTRGRQLRRFGRVVLPTVQPGGAWASDPPDLADAMAVPAPVARQWRENARSEHASVAAFAKLSLQLIALGAPPRLIAFANEDALDEIRHAEACFGLARALDGVSEGPAPFAVAQHLGSLPRSRTLALAQLAVQSLIDGALHEGVSARIIAVLAARCESDGMRSVLKQLAADEGRHAAHGWDVVEWCLEEGGEAVAQALRGAIHVLPDDMNSKLPPEAEGGDWERWGIHGHALEQQQYEATRVQLGTRIAVLTTLR